MKISRTLEILTLIVAVLALLATSAGLFWQTGGSPFAFTTLHGEIVQMYGQGLYANDTLFSGAGARGTDVITLFLCLPLLLAALLMYDRGRLRGKIFLTCMLGYFLYIAATMALSAAYNNLFLLYIAYFTASFFAFVLAFNAIDLQALPAHISERLPRRGIAVFLLVAGGATLLLWLSEILGPLSEGRVPTVLGSYTTVVTFVLDLGLITPLAILSGVLVLRRHPLGYPLSALMLVLNALVGFTVISQTVFQLRAGITYAPGQFIGLVGSWVIMGLFAIGLVVAFFRNIVE